MRRPSTSNSLPFEILSTFLLLQQRASVAVGLFFGGQDHGGGHAVAGFHVQEADALRIAAGLADGFRIHANDFAVLADQHDLGVFVDQGDGDHFADSFRRLHINHAFAGAVSEAIFVGGSSLAASVFADGEDHDSLFSYIHHISRSDVYVSL